MVRYKILQPSLIRFTADQIPRHFDNGVDLNATVENIAKGTLNPENIAAISVFKIKGTYHTINNRRLYVFRAAQHMGALDYISVIVESPCDHDLTVIKPGHRGKIISFIDQFKIYPHWSEYWETSHTGQEMITVTQPRGGGKVERGKSGVGKKVCSCDRTDDHEKLLDDEEGRHGNCCQTVFCCSSQPNSDHGTANS